MNTIIAKILHFLGFKLGVSGFEDYTTYGYGKLDDNGFWQFTYKIEKD